MGQNEMGGMKKVLLFEILDASWQFGIGKFQVTSTSNQ